MAIAQSIGRIRRGRVRGHSKCRFGADQEWHLPRGLRCDSGSGKADGFVACVKYGRVGTERAGSYQSPVSERQVCCGIPWARGRRHFG